MELDAQTIKKINELADTLKKTGVAVSMSDATQKAREIIIGVEASRPKETHSKDFEDIQKNINSIGNDIDSRIKKVVEEVKRHEEGKDTAEAILYEAINEDFDEKPIESNEPAEIIEEPNADESTELDALYTESDYASDYSESAKQEGSYQYTDQYTTEIETLIEQPEQSFESALEQPGEVPSPERSADTETQDSEQPPDQFQKEPSESESHKSRVTQSLEESSLSSEEPEFPKETSGSPSEIEVQESPAEVDFESSDSPEAEPVDESTKPSYQYSVEVSAEKEIPEIIQDSRSSKDQSAQNELTDSNSSTELNLEPIPDDKESETDSKTGPDSELDTDLVEGETEDIVSTLSHESQDYEKENQDQKKKEDEKFLTD